MFIKGELCNAPPPLQRWLRDSLSICCLPAGRLCTLLEIWLKQPSENPQMQIKIAALLQCNISAVTDQLEHFNHFSPSNSSCGSLGPSIKLPLKVLENTTPCSCRIQTSTFLSLDLLVVSFFLSVFFLGFLVKLAHFKAVGLTALQTERSYSSAWWNYADISLEHHFRTSLSLL